jgi:hypothetical protein
MSEYVAAEELSQCTSLAPEYCKSRCWRDATFNWQSIVGILSAVAHLQLVTLLPHSLQSQT